MRSKTLAMLAVVICASASACGSGSGEVSHGGDLTITDQELPEPGGEPARVTYGSDASQFADLSLPVEGGAPAPVVVLIHGGFWRTGFGLELMEPLVPSLTEAGYAVWNIEYRRVGGGGGRPNTFDDVAAATDALAALPSEVLAQLDLERVATVGHSAGGHLAAWLASRTSIPVGEPWSDPVVVPVLAVSQAGVLDLERCVEVGTGGSSCIDLLDGDASASVLATTSPAAMLPIGARVVAVHGELDRIVPPDQSEAYVADAAESGSDAELRLVPDADHFSMIDPGHPAWAAVFDALNEL